MAVASMREDAGLREQIRALAPWFHNLHLPGGVQTAPDHPLGDFPSFKWAQIAPHLPDDLSGWTALDIGCNAGFYSFELARRGAAVTAVDVDPHYLRQARWAAERLGLGERIAFRRMQIYDLVREPQRYDLVWFMGVLYHLRHPLLALDIVRRKTRRLMVLQALTAPGEESAETPPDLPIDARERLRDPAWPTMAFIERRLAGDPTNWWAPTHACLEAMLRSAGFEIRARIAHETYLCAPGEPAEGMAGAIEAELRAATGT
ncbi:tRNA (mo5U34)-methyltransferase [Vulcaniibacterium tengchongense]|uniref:tRNA (Mo5U34)-methyltransferase n=2 Tax=Vulcaniibacterium tengchongense TaxID=1273429 RepID=A0A3N4VDQ5_9GAMM|nr:tRNA (mo5U34)-methyltransferase [Vulcaniibacterium tengchongense]